LPQASAHRTAVAASTTGELDLVRITRIMVEYLAEHKSIAISAESVRQILRKAGIRWQATKTWKASPDPDLAQKMTRVLDLYDHPPANARVICADEFGPLSLQPAPAGDGSPPPIRPGCAPPITAAAECGTCSLR
jgi:hypothetical protein